MPIDELQASGKYPKWTYDDMPPSLRKALHTWDGVGYGVLNDADGQVLYYRRDVLNDPKWQAEFKAEYGYDMPDPPQTWQQLLDISQVLQRQELGRRRCRSRIAAWCST